MRPWNLRRLALVPALAFAMSASFPAEAQTLVLPAPQDSTEVRELRVAFSSFSGQSASWVQLGLYGGADDVFVVVPAPAGARVDLASDAWFEALSATTNPRVLPPQGDPPACTGKPAPAPGTVDVVGSDDHQGTVAPESGTASYTLSQLLVWAGSEGLSLSGEQAAALADLEVTGHLFVVVRFQPGAGESLTRTIRVAPSSPAGFLPLLLSRAGADRIPVSAWIFSAGKAVPEGLPAHPVDASKVKWSMSAQPSSNYAKLRDTMLSGAKGEAWVVDGASHAALFFHTSLPAGTGMVPSLAGAYFERAAGYGDATDSYATCTGKFATLESSMLKVSAACGRGDLAKVSAGACTETTSEYETNPEFVRCGPNADDLAIALSGAIPAHAWITRWTSWIEPLSARAEEAFHPVSGAQAVGPLFTASGWENECTGDAGADSGSAGSGSGGTSGSSGGKGGSSGGWAGSSGSGGYNGSYGGYGGSTWGGGYGNNTGNPGQGGYYYDEDDDYYYEDSSHVGVYAEGSCSSSSSSSSGGDSCSGDSSSSESGGDSCSSDSSSDSGGDSCSGSSSDGEAESCSGDSSGSEAESCSGDSSSGGGESCSGSSSSGGGAESCSGSSGGSSDCSVARTKGGRKRPPLSGMTLGLVAVLLPLRRLLRARGQNRPEEGAKS